MKLINDEVASTLVLQALGMKQGGGKNPKLDVIVERIGSDLIDGKYAAFTFFAVKKGKLKSAPRALGELVLKDVVSKLLDHAKGEASAVYSLAGDLSGGLDGAKGGWMDKKKMDEIYSSASEVGGQMQLHAAKKMGQKTFDLTRVYGLSADVVYGGVVRFESVEYGTKGVDIVLRYWNGLSGSASFIDGFQGKRHDVDGNKQISKLHEWGGHHKAQYIYSPITGKMW